MAECDVYDFDAATGEQICYKDGVEVWRRDALSAIKQASAAPSSGTTLIGADGKAAAPSPQTTTPVQQATPQPETAAPAPSGEWYDTGSSGQGGYSGRSRGGYGGGGGGYYYDPSYGYSGDGNYGSFGSDPFANLPAYQDGTFHPASPYGQPRVPGGIFAQQDDGYDDRTQVTATSGATAGPFAVRAAPAPDSGNYGGSADSGGGGGGGDTRGVISAWRDKLIGNAYPNSSSTSSSTTTEQQYRRQGRRMDRAYERYNEAVANPDPLPVRGFVKRAGYAPGSVAGLLSQPQGLLADIYPGFQQNETTDSLFDMPMTDLAMISFGTKGRGLLTKTPVPKVPGTLRREAGVEPIKPDYKRTLDPSKVANKIALLYRQMTSDGGEMPFTSESLLGDLAGASKKSALRQGLRQQFEYDPGSALDSIGSYVSTALTAPMGQNAWSRALQRGVQRDAAMLGAEAFKRKPKRASKALNQFAQSYLE